MNPQPAAPHHTPAHSLAAGAPHRVVLGVSASASGYAALKTAVQEARRRHASLHLVRVWREVGWLFSATAADIAGLRDSERADELVLALAEQAAHTLAPDVHVLSDYASGDLYGQLQTRTVGADLLVLGAGEDATTPLISEWFTRHAHCPVLAVDGASRPVDEGTAGPNGTVRAPHDRATSTRNGPGRAELRAATADR